MDKVCDADRLRKILSTTMCIVGYLQDSDNCCIKSSEQSLNMILNTQETLGQNLRIRMIIAWRGEYGLR